MQDNDLRQTVSKYTDFSGFGPNWRLFGSSGHEKELHHPVISRFTMASDKDNRHNRHVKAIVQPEFVKGMRTHRPFLLEGIFVDEKGNEISNDRGIHDRVSYEFVRINHYITKSKQEWLNKVSRGKADNFSKRKNNDFSIFDLNEKTDVFILKFYERFVDEATRLVHEAGINDYPMIRSL